MVITQPSKSHSHLDFFFLLSSFSGPFFFSFRRSILFISITILSFFFLPAGLVLLFRGRRLGRGWTLRPHSYTLFCFVFLCTAERNCNCASNKTKITHRNL
ncbi:hypothetical protein COCSADRAFT_339809 [Bipolaris sorokiniana ND90Pr]|uniref:Transmembrane protein n=1 Tax=Cochliobolus sativus (strain ND90Pr / ATCC 201652) TaxID=665912 RepID=M2SLV8_COCSN|nr:uncharacterized protein COCSADRAFT_339809 [Bipolaris sorokiniana ND90Pr]EMD63285.1 hypothetical protein COCSADRAFT_339809 [Bipolaris sorokiniana ND90Pr]